MYRRDNTHRDLALSTAEKLHLLGGNERRISRGTSDQPSSEARETRKKDQRVCRLNKAGGRHKLRHHKQPKEQNKRKGKNTM